jgi:carbamoyl-phosphate synthase large subunit
MHSVLLLLVIGGLLVVLGTGWRTIATRRVRQQLISLLGSADPATRAATLPMVAAEGIERFASTLRCMSETETEPTVLDALTEAVNRTRATPARSPDLISLRLWAAVRTPAGSATPAGTAAASAAISRPVLTEITGTDEGHLVNSYEQQRFPAIASRGGGAPRTAALPGTFIPVEAASANGRKSPVGAAPANGRKRKHPPAGTQEDMGHRGPRQRHGLEDGQGWGGSVVLVTGAGGPAGVAVIRALRGAGRRVFAVDADSSAVGFRLADEFACVPRADDPTFVESLVKAATRSGAGALIPTVAEELTALHAAAGQLGDAGVATWLPHPWSVEHCVDKLLFYQLMTKYGVPVPVTAQRTSRGVPGPWIVKPRFGRGSRDVYDVADAEDLTYALCHTPKPLIQTKLAGQEFTVDTLSDDDGQLYGAVPRWRVETKAGISTKGLTFDHPELVEKVAALLAVLRLAGPACVQGFLTEDGELGFTEVNPRFSGGLPLSLAAGADLVGQYLNRILGGTVQPERLRFRPGVTMLRYFDEVFEE